MAEKFTIHVGQKSFDADGTSIEQNYSNEFGKWHVIAKRAGTGISGVISLKPAPCDLDISKVAPKIEFINTYDSISYNMTATATKIPDQQCFLFAIYAYGVYDGYSTYEIEVEIDLGPLSFISDLPSSVDHSKEMFESGKLADITITSTGKKQIKAHNYILSRSPVFDAMLNAHDTKEAQEKVIEIKDIEYKVLVEMLRFIYTDKIPKMKEMACALLVAANKYDLPGLANACGNYLIKNVAVESFGDVLITADKLELPQLKASAIDFVINNRKTIFATDGWKQLKDDNMKLAMEVLEKFVADS